jgi:hypothetical protein
MLLVVLGAGASYDAIGNRSQLPAPERVWAPPLTRDLFGVPNFLRILNDYPAARGLAEHVRHALAVADRPTTLEDELDRAEREAERDPLRRRALVAMRFYLQDLFKRCSEDWLESQAGLTNQQWLVRTIELWRASRDEPVLWVTFNYDTILDTAIEDHYGVDLAATAGLQAYAADSRYVLIKLHGSYNWATRTSLAPAATWQDSLRRLINEAGNYNVIGPIRHLGREAGRRVHVADLVELVQPGVELLSLPAIAIPLRSKDEFACPLEHVARLETLLPSVDRVLSIGWRGAEASFLERLKSIRQETMFWVVAGGPTGADETIRNIRDAGVPGNFQRIHSEGFSDFRESPGDLSRMLS